MVNSQDLAFKTIHSAGCKMSAPQRQLPDEFTAEEESTIGVDTKSTTTSNFATIHAKGSGTTIEDTTDCASRRTATRTRRPHLPFFDLPAEIRNMIYGYIVDKSWLSTTWSIDWCPPGFGMVNRQMRAEMMPIYFTRLGITMDIGRQTWWENVRKWVLAVGDSVKFLGNLTIIVTDSAHSWGVASFTIATCVGDVDHGFTSKFLSPYSSTEEATILNDYPCWLYQDIKHLNSVGLLNGRNLVALLLAFYNKFRAVSRGARAVAGLPTLDN